MLSCRMQVELLIGIKDITETLGMIQVIEWRCYVHVVGFLRPGKIYTGNAQRSKYPEEDEYS